MASNRFLVDDKTRMQNTAEELLNANRKSRPFPVSGDDNYQLWLSLIRPAYAEVLRTFGRDSECSQVFVTSNNSSVSIPNGRININFDRYHPAPAQWYSEFLVRPDHPQYADIVQWCDDAKAMDVAITTATQGIKRILNACNTPGQLVRVFSGASFLLTHYNQQQLTAMKKASRWPKDLTTERAYEISSLVTPMLSKGALLGVGSTTPPIWVD